MAFAPGDCVEAPITDAAGRRVYRPARIIAIYPVALSDRFVADVNIPALYRPGSSGYGDPYATVRLDVDTLRPLPASDSPPR